MNVSCFCFVLCVILLGEWMGGRVCVGGGGGGGLGGGDF